jgi:hypothetical protein
MTLYLVFRSDVVQTVMARLAADFFSRELKTEIRIRGFNISISNGLMIEDISVLDREKVTIFSAHKLGVKPGFMVLKTRKLNIKKVFIEKGIVQLLTHKGDSAMSMQFIIDYFTSKDTGKKTDTTAAVP